MTNEQGSSPASGFGPGEQPARSKREVVVLLLRNSPWLSIAVLLHLHLIAIFSVIYIAHEAPVEKAVDMAVNIAKAPLVLPEAIEEPPEIIDRNSVPTLPDEPEGPVNPDPVYIPDADPGREGEITDEIDPNKDPGIFNPDPEALSNLPSGATGGTPIGVGSVGHHGTGTPSAYASRRAGGGGKGGGGLGQGGGGGRGGTQINQATDAALQWLKNHQSPDGSWSAANFSEQCKANTCGGAGNPVYDTGLTGLALLCFLGAGETHQSPLFGNTVKAGLKYLMEIQDEAGCFGDRIGHGWVYNHACAALAMAEAYGMTGSKAFKDPAQKGINFVLQAQNPYAAWRYDFPPIGDNDSSVTGWMVMALKSAILSSLKVDTGALDNAVNFIDEITDPATGRTGYTSIGENPSRLPLLASAFPSEKSESLTAVGMLVRIFGGRTLDSDEMLGKGADLLVTKLPTWNPDDGSIDFYYWYYGTLAMHQVGGPRWEKWNEAIKTALVDHQRLNKDEDEYGSWDPVDPWSTEGGRVYSTALNCLSTEVYYRYDRVFGTTEHAAKSSGSKDASKTGDGK